MLPGQGLARMATRRRDGLSVSVRLSAGPRAKGAVRFTSSATALLAFEFRDGGLGLGPAKNDANSLAATRCDEKRRFVGVEGAANWTATTIGCNWRTSFWGWNRRHDRAVDRRRMFLTPVATRRNWTVSRPTALRWHRHEDLPGTRATFGRNSKRTNCNVTNLDSDHPVLYARVDRWTIEIFICRSTVLCSRNRKEVHEMVDSEAGRPTLDHRAECRILSLDGGGAKGIYTLGVLKEVEAMAPSPLHECFDVIYGTSTGSIIATLLACGESIEWIREKYLRLIPDIMGQTTAPGRTQALIRHAEPIFSQRSFDDCLTCLGIVAVRCDQYRPMIFKNTERMAQGRHATFVPGFGAPLSQAVIASCSAYPYFEKSVVHTTKDGDVEVVDGGFVANDPTLFALTDAVRALGKSPDATVVLSIGTGDFPAPTPSFWKRWKKRLASPFLDIEFAETIMRSNANSMEQLRQFLLPNTTCIRINERFNLPKHQTTFLESDPNKLNEMFNLGSDSFGKEDNEQRIREAFGWPPAG